MEIKVGARVRGLDGKLGEVETVRERVAALEAAR
jgi:hypothetical protein